MTRPATDAPLTWNVAGLLGDDPGTSREFDVADVTIPLDEGMALARPINGHVRFQRTNRGILADARLTAALQAECSRCLRPMEVPVDIVLEEEFLPAIDMASGAPLSTEDEPDVARLTDHHELELEPLVRDELVRIFGDRPQRLIAPMRDLLISLPPAMPLETVAWLAEEFAAMDPNALALESFLLTDGALSCVPLRPAEAHA